MKMMDPEQKNFLKSLDLNTGKHDEHTDMNEITAASLDSILHAARSEWRSKHDTPDDDKGAPADDPASLAADLTCKIAEIQRRNDELARDLSASDADDIGKTFARAGIVSGGRPAAPDHGMADREQRPANAVAGKAPSAQTVKKLTAEQRKAILDKADRDLADLVGLASVKKDVGTIRATLEAEIARKSLGLMDNDDNSMSSHHVVFEGRAGTGKTTVARVYAKILLGLGIISSDRFIETDRAGLVGQYQGETAAKVTSVVKSALDGVLFIDEAYALKKDDKDTYGEEAVSTLLKLMEDNRDRLVVIIAGYTDETEVFLDSNPGLRSRFSEKLVFPDYTREELVKILCGMASHKRIELTEDMRSLASADFDKLREMDGFSNGRTVRSFFDNALKSQSLRFSDAMRTGKLDEAARRAFLTTFTVDDMTAAFDKTSELTESVRDKFRTQLNRLAAEDEREIDADGDVAEEN
jgi:SpoVK/Ycf46/Vps4 family AAA+-type ATPase